MRAQRGHGGIYVKVHEKYGKLVPQTEAQQKSGRRLRALMEEELSLKEEAYLYFSHSNTLYPFLFPGTRKFDSELIAITSNLLHAKEPAGTITGGGTESIFLAMKCWRSYAETERGIGGLHRGAATPNVVLCVTAHPAFVKALHSLRIEARFVAMNDGQKEFGTVNVSEMESAIDSNTICLVASASCFPFSVVDDIEAICGIASLVMYIPLLFFMRSDFECALLIVAQSEGVIFQSTSTTVWVDSVSRSWRMRLHLISVLTE